MAALSERSPDNCHPLLERGQAKRWESQRKLGGDEDPTCPPTLRWDAREFWEGCGSSPRSLPKPFGQGSLMGLMEYRAHSNTNCNLSNKEPELNVSNIVGVFLEFSEISVLGKLLIVNEDRETSSVKLPITNAYRGCSFSKNKTKQKNLCRL